MVACTSTYGTGIDIIGFDIEFNDNLAFAIGVVSGKYDVESVAVHEAGHVAGVTHIYDCAQVMGLVNDTTACLTPGMTRRSLGWGDQNGAQALYPVDNTLLLNEAGAIYVTRTGLVRYISNPITFEANGFNWGSVLLTSNALFAGFPAGYALMNVLADGNLLYATGQPNIYVMQAGVKRWVLSPDVMTACSYGFDGVRIVSPTLLNGVPTGTALAGPPCPHLIPPHGYLIKSGDPIYVMENGVKRWITSMTVFNNCSYHGGNVDNLVASYVDDIPSGANLTGPPCPRP